MSYDAEASHKDTNISVTCVMCGRQTNDAFESHDGNAYVCSDCVCKMYRHWYFERKAEE